MKRERKLKKIYLSNASYLNVKKAVNRLKIMGFGDTFVFNDEELTVDAPTRSESEVNFLNSMKQYFNSVTRSEYLKLRGMIKKLQSISPATESEAYAYKQYQNGTYRERVNGVIQESVSNSTYNLDNLYNLDQKAKSYGQKRKDCEELIVKIEREHSRKTIFLSLNEYLPRVFEKVGGYYILTPMTAESYNGLSNEVAASKYQGTHVLKSTTNQGIADYISDIGYSRALEKISEKGDGYEKYYIAHKVYKEHWFLRAYNTSAITGADFRKRPAPMDKHKRDEYFQQTTVSIDRAIVAYLTALEMLWKGSLYYQHIK